MMWHFFCLQAEVNASDIVTNQVIALHKTVGIVLAYLNYHTYILLVVVFTLFGGLTPTSDLLVCL